MPETIRERLIEAGMEAFATTEAKWEPPDYGIDELAEACLDAFLDTLTEAADEWTEPLDWVEVRKLIAVLRDGDDV